MVLFSSLHPTNNIGFWLIITVIRLVNIASLMSEPQTLSRTEKQYHLNQFLPTSYQ